MKNPVDTEKYWSDRLIEHKDHIHFSIYVLSDGKFEEMLKRHVIELYPYRHMKVLDAGCGYGRMNEYFSNYTGVDFVHSFIDKGQELYPGINLQVANLKKLPFKDKEFDMAFCVLVKGNVTENLGESEWLKMEKEINRVANKLIILEL